MMTIHDIVDAHNEGRDDETAQKLGIHKTTLRVTLYTLKKLGYPVKALKRGRPRKIAPAKAVVAKPQKTKVITDVSQWWAERGF